MAHSTSLEKVTVRLDRGTREKLLAFYPDMKYNVVIRALLTRHLRTLEERANRNLHELLTKEELNE